MYANRMIFLYLLYIFEFLNKRHFLLPLLTRLNVCVRTGMRDIYIYIKLFNISEKYCITFLYLLEYISIYIFSISATAFCHVAIPTLKMSENSKGTSLLFMIQNLHNLFYLWFKIYTILALKTLVKFKYTLRLLLRSCI